MPKIFLAGHDLIASDPACFFRGQDTKITHVLFAGQSPVRESILPPPWEKC